MRFLIVGAGLAGTTAAHLLRERHMAFELMDSGENVSSAVAGGIINPLVFRRMTLSWRLDELLPVAHRFFEKREQEMNKQFYHAVPIRRFFASEQERDFWLKKQDLPDFQPYMQTQTSLDAAFPSPSNTHGTGLVLQSGYVDAARYTEANRLFFEELGVLRKEKMDYSQLDPIAGSYKGVAYDCILFCEGKDALYNPWFRTIPLQATKGEVLTIDCATASQEESYNRKCFMMPIGNHQFRVGSTYDWDVDNTIPTEVGKKTITENLASILTEDYTISSHHAGVRPTIKDRRPVLGRHPHFPKLAIGNGLGAKGYMLAPLIIEELLDHLIAGTPVHPETRIERFQFPTTGDATSSL